MAVLTMDTKSPFSVKLSAPGKVILFGEYSVLFKRPAVAASLNLRTKLHIYKTDSSSVRLEFPQIKLSEIFDVNDIKEQLEIITNVTSDSWDDYLLSLTKVVESLCKRTDDDSDLTESQKFAVMAFFHCFGKILNTAFGFNLEIDSELPVGAGVGSSASFSIVLSASALLMKHIVENGGTEDLVQRNENSISLTEKFKNQISKLAFSCERIFHGSPSGVDHNTVLHGFMLEFIKADDVKYNKITFINTSPLKILLVNTNFPRSTKKLVASVKQLREDHPDVIECVLNGMENLAKSAVKDLIDFKETQVVAKKRLEAHFGELISINHNLLRVLGASHPSLERIVLIANKHNLRAKLTGGGGGGFALIYVPSQMDASIIKTVETELTSCGYTVYDVSLGGPGLTIEELTV